MTNLGKLLSKLMLGMLGFLLFYFGLSIETYVSKLSSMEISFYRNIVCKNI